MTLTIEECEEAYKELHFKHADLKFLLVFANLIKEHFDNPPLKFEELEENMWVWDNKYKLYVQIDEDFKQKDGFIIVVFSNDYHNQECEYTTFAENRFYRREVKDNG